MGNLDSLIGKLKSGTRQEKVDAFTELAKLNDLMVIDELRKIKEHSDDAEFSLIACYVLAMSGDSEAAKSLKTLFDNHPNRKMQSSVKSLGVPSDFLKIFNLFKIANEIEEANQAIYLAHPREAKEKLQKLLSSVNRCIEGKGPFLKTSLCDGIAEFAAKRAAGLIFSSLGLAELRLGNIEESFSCGGRALAIGTELQDGQVLSTASANLGIAYMEVDKYYQALDCFHKSLQVMEERIDPWRKKNRVLCNMSILYCRLGDAVNALEYARKALNEARKEKDNLGIGWCLNAHGVASLNSARDTEAEAFFLEALECRNKTEDRQAEGISLINLGYIYFERKDNKTAEDFLCRALRILEDAGNKSTAATVLVNLAYLYLGQGDTSRAHECAMQAFTLAEDTASIRDDADACYILGRIYHDYYQDFESAYDYYKKAIAFYEAIRKELVADNLKITFAENSALCYAQMVSLCVDLGRKKEAFEYVERSKSRALVELLSKTLEGINPRADATVRTEEVKRLKDKFVSLEMDLRAIYKKTRITGISLDERAVTIFETDESYARLSSVERQYKEVYEELKRLDPEFASFAGVEPVKIEELRCLLDDETYLIEYYQCAEKIFIFVISPELEIDVCHVPIVNDDELSRLSLLFGDLCGPIIHDTESHDFYKKIKMPLTALYDLLIGPIEKKIKGAKRLVIAPHFNLHYLPFHALYDSRKKEYLIDQFEISCAPSAEVLKYCHKKNDVARKRAAIFANPTGDLPHSEEEARKIAECFLSDVRLFVGKSATIEELEALDEVDIVHLACHGIYRADEPILSHLLLADTEEGQGGCFLPDIFNLRLKTPTLVTLSACESGLSTFSSGDELIGFARAFFYAGAPSIMASLWRVNDRSTSLFMDVFYKNIKKHLPKSKALQSAIQELKSKPGYQHPYFWAPFVLMGDWK